MQEIKKKEMIDIGKFLHSVEMLSKNDLHLLKSNLGRDYKKGETFSVFFKILPSNVKRDHYEFYFYVACLKATQILKGIKNSELEKCSSVIKNIYFSNKESTRKNIEKLLNYSNIENSNFTKKLDNLLKMSKNKQFHFVDCYDLLHSLIFWNYYDNIRISWAKNILSAWKEEIEINNDDDNNDE